MDLHVSSVTDRKARKSEQNGKESVFLRLVNERTVRQNKEDKQKDRKTY